MKKPGEFADLISKDFELIKQVQDDSLIQTANKSTYKQTIKAKIKAAAKKQEGHLKVKEIQYENSKYRRTSKTQSFQMKKLTCCIH
jgi:hypothetical protein